MPRARCNARSARRWASREKQLAGIVAPGGLAVPQAPPRVPGLPQDVAKYKEKLPITWPLRGDAATEAATAAEWRLGARIAAVSRAWRPVRDWCAAPTRCPVLPARRTPSLESAWQ